MFTNMGRKIQILAKVLCWIGIAVSIIGGAFLIYLGVSTKVSLEILYGILAIIFGSLISWIGSFMMVGFGQLVESNAEIAREMRRLNSASDGNRDLDD